VTDAQRAVAALLGHDEVLVERLTKDGRRQLDARAAVLRMEVSGAADAGPGPDHAILDVVVRQVTPTVRPDDVVAALRAVAGLAPAGPPLAVRLAQGPLDDAGAIGDPLAADRAASASAAPSQAAPQ
jgi:hypothetical protein